MALKLIKDEVLKEMEAVKCFIELAIKAQKAGYTTAAAYFIGQAQEDCGHAFKYAIALDKHDELEGNASISEIVKTFQDLEVGATGRVTAIRAEVEKEGKQSLLPFVHHMLEDHSNEAYEAKKLLQKINILGVESLSDIEDLFKDLMEEDED